jgi:hypothetical protein
VLLNNDENGTHANEKYSESYLKKFLSRAQTRPTIATTWGSGAQLIQNHSYVIEKINGETVHVWEAMRQSPDKVSVKDFFNEFDAVYQALSTRCL